MILFSVLNLRRIYGIEYLELYYSQSREAQHHRRQSGVSQDVIISHHDQAFQALSLGREKRIYWGPSALYSWQNMIVGYCISSLLILIVLEDE